MKIDRTHRSPNHDPIEIDVQFIVIHHTACSLKKTLELFEDQSAKVSSHFVIDTDGAIFELVPALDGKALRAWHAGKSALVLDNKSWEGFNDLSIGIELVNRTGNLFPFTDAQYVSLVELLGKLQTRYPNLSSPERIVGHEEIAGFRGKIDPGVKFEWERVYSSLYPSSLLPSLGTPTKKSSVPREIVTFMENIVKNTPKTLHEKEEFWEALSAFTEKAAALLKSANPKKTT